MATKRRELLGITSVEDLDVLDQVTGVMPAEQREQPGCLAKADLDEPLFILRAQDRCAPAAVRDWAQRAKNAGSLTQEKFDEAMSLAGEMERWQEANPGRAKFPD